MKRLYIIQFIILILMSSCSDDSNCLFDKSVDERIAESKQETENLLTNSDLGWRAYYRIAQEDKEYYDVKCLNFVFDKTNNVIISSLMEDKSETTDFEIVHQTGLVLKFNKYNETLTSLVTPDPDFPKGHGGDIEFTIMKITQDTIQLKGIVSESDLVLVRTKESDLNLDVAKACMDKMVYYFNHGFVTLSITEGFKDVVNVRMKYDESTNITSFSYSKGEDSFFDKATLGFNANGIALGKRLNIFGEELDFFDFDGDNFTFDTGKIKGKIVRSDLPLEEKEGVTDNFLSNSWHLHLDPEVISQSSELWSVLDNTIGMWMNRKLNFSFVYLVSNFIDKTGVNRGNGLLLTKHSDKDSHYVFVPAVFTKLSEARVNIKFEGDYVTYKIGYGDDDYDRTRLDETPVQLENIDKLKNIFKGEYYLENFSNPGFEVFQFYGITNPKYKFMIYHEK